MASLDADYALALRLHHEELARTTLPVTSPTAAVTSPAAVPTSLVDESYELIDPTPDIHQLFCDFNRHFFYGKLGAVELKWSPRMTRCAGVCSYQPGSGLCSVRLSRPLLTLRPRRDLVETLLHEMIHALLFVTRNSDNREEHGPEFHRHMRRINAIAGTSITVYHTFHDECRAMLTHWWRCSGVCRHRPPYFGVIKRSMNRAPGRNDFWWREHQASCGGTFEKTRQPEQRTKPTRAKKEPAAAKRPNHLRDIRNFLTPDGGRKPTGQSVRQVVPTSGGAADAPKRAPSGTDVSAKRPKPASVSRPKPGTSRPTGGSGPRRNVHGFQGTTPPGSGTITITPRPGQHQRGAPEEANFSGQGRRLGGAATLPWYRQPPAAAPAASAAPAAPRQPTGIFSERARAGGAAERPLPESVQCPVCEESVPLDTVNRHVDGCLLERVRTELSPGPLAACSGDAGAARAAATVVSTGDSAVWQEADSDDERLLTEAADWLETSLEAADRLETSQEAADRLDTSQEAADRLDTSLEAADRLDTSLEAADRLETSLEAAERLETSLEAADRLVTSLESSAGGSPVSSASTAYDDIVEAAIVIDSCSEDEESEAEYVRRRAGLSDTIRRYICVEESDDELS